MNRYLTQGILTDAQEGKSVLVVAENQRRVRNVFEWVTRALEAQSISALIRGANGVERIVFSNGGRVSFTSVRSAAGIADGLTVDVVLVEDSYAYERLYAQGVPAWLRMLQASGPVDLVQP